jgi:hypothetical protein
MSCIRLKNYALDAYKMDLCSSNPSASTGGCEWYDIATIKETDTMKCSSLKYYSVLLHF